MRNKEFRYIYGPVYSWRLGVSLGIDLLSSKNKICTFDCNYCQLGDTLRYTKMPKVYVKIYEVINELKSLPWVKIDPAPLKHLRKQLFVNNQRCGVDYITFSGRGDPALAGNLGKAIKAVKKLRTAPIAVLTNSSLINQLHIRKNLSLADFVIAKLDAYSQESLERINKPANSIKFRNIIKGIKKFKNNFKGKLALQIMFVKENQRHVRELARLAKAINPDEVQICTPTRSCAVKPLSRADIAKIKQYFFGLNFISVYDVKPKKITSLSKEDTLRRRGKVK